MRRSPFRPSPLSLALVAAGLGLAPAGAAPSVTVGALACVPVDGNAAVEAQVADNQPETSVRLYFRRLNDTVEDAYYVNLQPSGGGRYWGVLPQPGDFEPRRFDLGAARGGRGGDGDAGWAAWWQAKDLSDDRNPTQELDPQLIRERASQGKQVQRDWLREMDPKTLQSWLERQKYEPAEVYASVVAADGSELARSQTQVAPVTDDCAVTLDEAQRGLAQNLEVGETASWQGGEEPFHWNCEGVVSRRDPRGVQQGDGICRACVVAWWKMPAVVLPVAGGAALVGGLIIADDSNPPASPSVP